MVAINAHSYRGYKVEPRAIPRLGPPVSQQNFDWAESDSGMLKLEITRRQQETYLVKIFLTRLYEATEKDEHQAADEVFNFMDDHLLDDNFPVCDLVLEIADPEYLLPSGVVSLLMVTRRAKGRLPARVRFLDRAMDVVAHKEGRAEAEALLGKYR